MSSEISLSTTRYPQTNDRKKRLAASRLCKLGLKPPRIKVTPATSTTLQPNVLPIFGAQLSQQPQEDSLLLPRHRVPWFLQHSVTVLVLHASRAGLFGWNAPQKSVWTLKISVKHAASVEAAGQELETSSANTVAALLKEWLQLLPTPLLPLPVAKFLLKCRVEGNMNAVLMGLLLLPEDQLACLRHLLTGLAMIAEIIVGSRRSLANGIVPSICGVASVREGDGIDLADLVALVEAAIGCAQLVGSLPPRAPGRPGCRSSFWLPPTHPLLKALRSIMPHHSTDGSVGNAFLPTGLDQAQKRSGRILRHVLPTWKKLTRQENETSKEQQSADDPEDRLSKQHTTSKLSEGIPNEAQETSAAADSPGKNEDTPFSFASLLPQLRLKSDIHSQLGICGPWCACVFDCDTRSPRGSHRSGVPVPTQSTPPALQTPRPLRSILKDTATSKKRGKRRVMKSSRSCAKRRVHFAPEFCNETSSPLVYKSGASKARSILHGAQRKAFGVARRLDYAGHFLLGSTLGGVRPCKRKTAFSSPIVAKYEPGSSHLPVSPVGQIYPLSPLRCVMNTPIRAVSGRVASSGLGPVKWLSERCAAQRSPSKGAATVLCQSPMRIQSRRKAQACKFTELMDRAVSINSTTSPKRYPKTPPRATGKSAGLLAMSRRSPLRERSSSSASPQLGLQKKRRWKFHM